MKFAYRFSNLLGTVYRKGNLSFTADGNTVISPVGNRISLFDLKNNKTSTLAVESELNLTAHALSPDGSLLIAVDEEGLAYLISLRSRTLLHTYHFHRPVHSVVFSPDGRKFAATKENNILLFHAPGCTKEFNPFVLEKTFYGAYDETTSIDWSTDSQVLCVGGKDMNTRVYGARKFKNLIIYSMGGHTDAIINAFFEQDSLDVYSISGNGHLCVWDCDSELTDLIPDDGKPAESEDSDSDEEGSQAKKKKVAEADDTPKILYKRHAKHNFKAARGEGAAPARVSSAAYHKHTHILCTGFSDGAFFLHEMPDFNLIHSLSISDQVIGAVAWNAPGDWVALGCSGHGQLLVWEWQSESYVLKQQGHVSNMACVAYSPDGLYIATGGHDAKVKVWNTLSGFCFVTFSEHAGGVTGVTFAQSGHVVVSASLDGTVRAFDLNRYRNFRTLTSPHPAQFACLALDPSGEVVCAGAQDSFEIFVWSMQTGRLLTILSGHEGPVSGLAFSPTAAMLASASWDKTLKLWDVFENKGARESITFHHDVLAVAFRPDGKEVAVSTLDAQISFWDVASATQSAAIEGRADLGYTRRETDKITAKKSAAGKAFTTLCYTADGACVLAAGRSAHVCLYHVGEQTLVKKFAITCNRSLDGTQEFLDRRKMTEFGSLSLVDEGQADSEGQAMSLPGVRRGDMSSRHWRPEVLVTGVVFSPTGREWAATTTEGLLLYSLDHSLVFDPYDLTLAVTPDNVKTALRAGAYSEALMLALRLGEQPLVQEVVETTPPSHVSQVVGGLAAAYVDKTLAFCAAALDTTRHIDFYTRWIHCALVQHGPQLKRRSRDVMPTLRALQRGVTQRHRHLAAICDGNKYNMKFLLSLAATRQRRADKAAAEEGGDVTDEDEDDDDDAEKILSVLRNTGEDDQMEQSVESDTESEGDENNTEEESNNSEDGEENDDNGGNNGENDEEDGDKENEEEKESEEDGVSGEEGSVSS